MADRIEFEPEFEPEFDEDIEFEADEELEEALDGRGRSQIDMDELRARGREAWQSARERGRERLRDAALRGKTRFAEAIDNTATRLDDRLYGSAEYLRSSDLEVIRDDLVDVIRQRPLLSAGIALGAGYLIGKATNLLPKRGKSAIRKQLSRQLRRAVVSSLAAAVATRMRDTLAAAQEEPARAPRPRGPRKRRTHE